MPNVAPNNAKNLLEMRAKTKKYHSFEKFAVTASEASASFSISAGVGLSCQYSNQTLNSEDLFLSLSQAAYCDWLPGFGII